MSCLKVNLAGVTLKNPVITASGCCGYGREYDKLYPIERLGGISVKGTTLQERQGNPPCRIAETPSGMLNSVGLQNPGVEAFLQNELPHLKSRDVVVIANVAGSTVEEYCAIAERLDSSGIDLLEVNISCPNVKEGGAAFGTSCTSAAEVVAQMRRRTSKPMMVKLSPNVTDIVSIARAVEDAGADAVSLINTLLGMRIDLKTRRPVLHNNVGGLSGPAVFPVAVRMVWQVASAVKIPVVGMGGISCWQDAIEMMLAGARAVQIGAALFTDPYTPVRVIEGMDAWLEENGVSDVNEIVGAVRPW
ncbi:MULTISPECIES: dihydroorotate dehydrogenase [unclassified Anaerotruncus]|uniref:dihydroorotate dehydrogenase n=1 Tax=unclassified Anaerotruncus TaxID=2641626 RepID=UPI00033E4077|nr:MULTISPECIES: dihydroorotate dehydrogenase [unclassified Anaerotruncus]MCI9160694.1 dihydroorotate dehydrogenase [Anaerotruncus sp.]NCE73591.1 dihydroorotate dehydrogenase [Anaerotruncus sp. X29]RKJ97487.1 dihydroorotate dehydrogenase [Anaerotruncus sp. 1XD22-93]EOS56447.1 dihydroorotate dehydrogenase [Anaerotruncus sp. G3(2012)]NBK17549.1 dihydroorotate dehydrogenase [Anaerotruncus sp. 1XD42-93]